MLVVVGRSASRTQGGSPSHRALGPALATDTSTWATSGGWKEGVPANFVEASKSEYLSRVSATPKSASWCVWCVVVSGSTVKWHAAASGQPPPPRKTGRLRHTSARCEVCRCPGPWQGGASHL